MKERQALVINGREFVFAAGETILTVARRNNIAIPTLCYLKGATPNGRCRVCVVEIRGEAELNASCETPAADGMVIRTESPKVVAARKQSIARLLSMGNHNCAVRSTLEKSWTANQIRA